METESNLRHHLIKSLTGAEAHASFDDALAALPASLRGEVPGGLPYSIWQLVEHIRIAQWDILEFSRGPGHESPSWPEGYWPKSKAPADEASWQESLQRIAADRETFTALINDEQRDLFTPFPYGDGQTLLREALLMLDHNSYHTAEIIVIRRLLGAWK